MQTTDEFKELCRKLIDSRMKFCPGISMEEYAGYKEIVRYDLKKVHITTEPFKRVASVDCLLWFPVTRYDRRERNMAAEVVCTACTTLLHDLREAKKRLSHVTPEVSTAPAGRLALSFNVSFSHKSQHEENKYQVSTCQGKAGDKEVRSR